MENNPINKVTFTDIVVSINDFLIEADTVSGGIYIGKNGGLGLLAKCAMKEDQYLMQKFFGYMEAIPSKGTYEHRYYYEDMLIPTIMMDHLLNNDTDENILKKAKDHINIVAKWMDKKGILAIADITFSHEIGSEYMRANENNMNIIKSLSKDYTIHILGNCNKVMMDKMVDRKLFEHVNGNIMTSSDLKDMKCSQSKRYDIYDKFLQKCGIDPVTTLFIETHQGHIDALGEYGKTKNIQIQTILYDCKLRDVFITNLSNMLGVVFSVEVGETETEVNVIETKLTRVGSVIAGFVIKNNKLYEQLINKDGTFFLCFDGNTISEITRSEYDEIFKV